LGDGIEILCWKNISFKQNRHPHTSEYILDLDKQWEMYMNFGTWNMRSLNWSGTLKTVDRELAKFRSDLLGIQEVLLGKVVTE